MDASTMIELDQMHFGEMSESEIDILDSDALKKFPDLTRANYVDRVGFPSEDNKGKTAFSSIDSSSAYYKSMNKILLLTREQEIIRMRYGLNETEKEHTLKECGEKFQVTRERIRQIEEKAIAKLRGICHSNKLREYAYYVSSR
jgi:DNA-directed RNA polymerase specialized sigma subunit